MIKKNLILTVTETQDSGEELLYTIKSVSDRETFILASGAPEVLVRDTKELLEAIDLVQQFGKDNPTVIDNTKTQTVADPLGIQSIEFGKD